jgi:hypothetical protein
MQPKQGELTLFHVWCCTAMVDKETMVLQTYTHSENMLVGPYGETYPACNDGDDDDDHHHFILIPQILLALSHQI